MKSGSRQSGAFCLKEAEEYKKNISYSPQPDLSSTYHQRNLTFKITLDPASCVLTDQGYIYGYGNTYKRFK